MEARKKILCAVDFTSGSEAAIDKACELARALECDLELVHVYPLPGLTTASEARRFSKETVDELSIGAPASLRALQERLTGRGVSVSTRLIGGEAIHELLLRSREPDVSMIVLGTHSRTGLNRVLIGSVAEQVVRLADVPVLIVSPLSSPERAAERERIRANAT